MKLVSVVALAALVAVVGGCAGTDSGAAVSSGPPANVAGTWIGGTSGAATTTATMQLSQTGAAVTGTLDVGGMPMLSGPLTGTVAGNSLHIQLGNAAANTGDLNVSGNSMTGEVAGNGMRLQRRP
jgi:hypothetical protein